jgi:hypothetical protein
MLTTMLPWKLPAGRQGVPVMYMGTLQPASMWRTGTPAARRAVSKVNAAAEQEGDEICRASIFEVDDFVDHDAGFVDAVFWGVVAEVAPGP